MTLIDDQELAEQSKDNSTFDARKRHKGVLWSALNGVPSFKRLQGAPKNRANWVLRFALIWVLLMLFFAIFANVLPIRSPNAAIGLPNVSPHWGRELFGLDAVGRSMVSRLIYGARTSFLIAICTTGLALSIGCTIGLLAVYFRGTINLLADMVCNTILSVPGLLFLLTVASVFKPSLLEIVLAIAITFLPAFIRLTRATALSQIEREYVVAARSLGARPARIIVRELLPNTLAALVTYAGIALPAVMLVEGGLSYLGFGIPIPTSSWGEMIAQGQPNIDAAPWTALIPAIVFAVTVFSLFILGDWLRARVDLKGVDDL